MADTSGNSRAPERRGRGSKGRKIDISNIKQDDRMWESDASDIFFRFAQKVGAGDDAARSELLDMLAIVLCKGTSYKRNYANIEFKLAGRIVQVIDLVEEMPHDHENDVRVWARSMPGFADLTFDLISKNPSLRREISLEYAVSLEMAPVSFDYSDAVTYDLTPNERQAIVQNTARKVGPARSDFFENDVRSEVSAAPANKAAVNSSNLGSVNRKSAENAYGL